MGERYTREQVEERQTYLRELTRGLAARLAELLRDDPDRDVSQQVELLRDAARGHRECGEQLARYDLMQLEPRPLEWTPRHGSGR